LIERGRVEIVRGEIVHVAQLGDRVIDGDNVLVDGERVFAMEYTYLAINKPVGYVSSRRAQGSSPTLYELVPKHFRHLKTVGRLDKDSSGLLLLTNDGDFAYHMTHPQFAKHKVYKVTLDQDLAPLHQQMISDFGVELADGKSKLVLVKDKSRKKWVVEMSEGRNRQIRRTFGALGYTVEALHRVQFGPYQIGGLKDGEIQEVTKIE
jgi:23S rRNA pseudouridine2605 synthase